MPISVYTQVIEFLFIWEDSVSGFCVVSFHYLAGELLLSDCDMVAVFVVRF